MNQNQQEQHTHTYPDMSFDWRGALAALALFASFFLVGPLLILLSLALQFWASRSIWHAPDRWASIRTLAWIFPLVMYIPTFLFRDHIALFWTAHLPGDFSIWPPTFSGIVARWVLALPLAFALALLLERANPRSLPLRFMIRRPRPGEMIAPYEPRKAEPQRLPITPQPGATATTKSAPAGQPTRKRVEHDPRPLGMVLAEEAERRKHAAQTPATASLTQAGQSEPKKAQPVSEEHTEEPTIPDPFKANKIDWSRVKE